jgi:hypothetical protein
VADASTIASLATAAGTTILAVATYSSTRSANRAARASELALLAGLRPVLFNARQEDPPQKVGYVDSHWVLLRDGLAAVQEHEQRLYLSIPLRNVGSGLAVLHGAYVWPRRALAKDDPAPVEDFRRLSRDLYVPAGDISFWQTAVREREDALYEPLRAAIAGGQGISVDILYGDHEGGQRTITRFYLGPREHPDADEPWLWVCTTSRHWNLDRDDPREH